MDGLHDNPKYVTCGLQECVEIAKRSATSDCLRRAYRDASGKVLDGKHLSDYCMSKVIEAIGGDSKDTTKRECESRLAIRELKLWEAWQSFLECLHTHYDALCEEEEEEDNENDTNEEKEQDTRETVVIDCAQS